MSQEVDKYYHVAILAQREDGDKTGIGFVSSLIKTNPDENIEVGAYRFAHWYFPDAEGWFKHGWHYGRIADSIIALERSAAHTTDYTPESTDVKAKVLT